MKSIKVKDLIIGEGRPKIAVSITGKTKEEVSKQIKKIDKKKVDIVEWRVDFFSDMLNIQKVLDMLKIFRELLEDIPIIFTFRTKKEGGEREISIGDYISLNNKVAQSKLIDIIDIQVFLKENIAKKLIDTIHKEGLFVIGSNHNFSNTPVEEDMIQILRKIENTGADILKLAVMPKSSEDVLRLLSVTNTMKKYTKRPVVTMSMGDLGTISRISGGVFGSSITFGALDKVSAPGQIHVDELFYILNLI